MLVAVFVIRQLVPPEDLQWLHQSQLMPHLNMLAEWTQIVFSNTSPRQAVSQPEMR